MKRVLSAIVFFSMVLMLFGCATVNEAWKEPAVISSSELKKSGAKKDITSMEELAESIVNIAEEPLFANDGEAIESADYADLFENVIIGKDLLKELEKAGDDLEKKGTASIDYKKSKKVLFKDKRIVIKDFYEEIIGKAVEKTKSADASIKLKFTETIDPKKFAKDTNINDIVCKLKADGSFEFSTKDDVLDGKFDLYIGIALAASFVDPKTERGGILNVSFFADIDMTAEDFQKFSSKRSPKNDGKTSDKEARELYDFFKPVLVIEMTNDDGVSTFRRECRTYDEFKKFFDEIEKIDEKFKELKELMSAADSSI